MRQRHTSYALATTSTSVERSKRSERSVLDWPSSVDDQVCGGFRDLGEVAARGWAGGVGCSPVATAGSTSEPPPGWSWRRRAKQGVEVEAAFRGFGGMLVGRREAGWGRSSGFGSVFVGRRVAAGWGRSSDLGPVFGLLWWGTWLWLGKLSVLTCDRRYGAEVRPFLVVVDGGEASTQAPVPGAVCSGRTSTKD
jgi:hypothetical protein